MARVNCTSISNLPSLSFLQNSPDSQYVTLPLVCLAMIRQDGWGFGFLLVTDFTDHYKSSVFNNGVPKKVPDDFDVGGKKLERSKVFSISIPAAKIESCWAEIRRFSPKMAKYHFLNYLTSAFPSEGVVALVNFRVRAHNNSVEGFLSHIMICNRNMLLAPSNQANVDEHGFKDFMARFSRYIDADLYDTLLPNFPIQNYVKRSAVMGAANRNERGPEDVITQAPSPPTKIRRLAGVQVMFQQQFTQTQQPPSREDLQREEDDDQNGIGDVFGTVQANGSLNYGAGDNLDSRRSRQNGQAHFHQSTTTAEELLQNWNLFAVNQVEFATFARIPCHLVNVGTSFVTKCKVCAIQPDARHILIKPFKRTLKIPPVSIYLSQGTDLVKVELHTEKEKCHFLGIHEVEEAINKIDRLTKLLRQLPGKTVEISIDKRNMALDFDYTRLYWSTATTLENMAK